MADSRVEFTFIHISYYLIQFSCDLMQSTLKSQHTTLLLWERWASAGGSALHHLYTHKHTDIREYYEGNSRLSVHVVGVGVGLARYNVFI